MEAIIAKLLGSILVGLLVKGGVALFGHSIAWGWAMLIGFVVVFGGFLIIDGDVIS